MLAYFGNAVSELPTWQRGQDYIRAAGTLQGHSKSFNLAHAASSDGHKVNGQHQFHSGYLNKLGKTSGLVTKYMLSLPQARNTIRPPLNPWTSRKNPIRAMRQPVTTKSQRSAADAKCAGRAKIETLTNSTNLWILLIYSTNAKLVGLPPSAPIN